MLFYRQISGVSATFLPDSTPVSRNLLEFTTRSTSSCCTTSILLSLWYGAAWIYLQNLSRISSPMILMGYILHFLEIFDLLTTTLIGLVFPLIVFLSFSFDPIEKQSSIIMGMLIFPQDNRSGSSISLSQPSGDAKYKAMYFICH